MVRQSLAEIVDFIRLGGGGDEGKNRAVKKFRENLSNSKPNCPKTKHHGTNYALMKMSKHVLVFPCKAADLLTETNIAFFLFHFITFQ